MPLIKKGKSQQTSRLIRHSSFCRDGASLGVPDPERVSDERSSQNQGDQARQDDACLSQTPRDEEKVHLRSPKEMRERPAMGLTKYERVHLLSSRATELSEGADPLVKMPGELDPLQIALRELEQGVLKKKIVRTFPSGERHIYPLHDL